MTATGECSQADTVVRDSVPEGDYVSQAVGLGPTTLWSYDWAFQPAKPPIVGPGAQNNHARPYDVL